MATYSPIDLSTVQPPSVVENVSYETLLSEMLTDLRSRDSQFNALVESDPAYKILEVCAYYRMLDRQRVNDAARQVMLAYAADTNLDNLGALFGVARLLITPGDANAIPPTTDVYEDDSEFRARIQLALDGLSTAGPVGSYIFHARKIAEVKDASVVSPDPGDVVVTVLGRTGNGVVSSGVINSVSAELNAENVRPLTDNVTVQAATIINYTITAVLHTYPGPDANTILSNAIASAQAFASAQHKLGHDINLSGIYAALHQPGVQRVELTQPAANIEVESDEAGYCTAFNITLGTVDT